MEVILGLGCAKTSKSGIDECGICQKIKYQRSPDWEDQVEHHLYSLSSLTSLSVDTLGPLKLDENGNSFIIVIVDNFSKLIELYPAKNTTSKDCLGELLQWVSIFGVHKEIRSDGGSQFAAPDIRKEWLTRFNKIII